MIGLLKAYPGKSLAISTPAQSIVQKHRTSFTELVGTTESRSSCPSAPPRSHCPMADSEDELEDVPVHRPDASAMPGHRRCPACCQTIRTERWLLHVQSCKAPPRRGSSTHGAAPQQVAVQMGGAAALALNEDDGAAGAQEPMDGTFGGGGASAGGAAAESPSADDTGLEQQQQIDERKEKMELLLAARKQEGQRGVSLRDLMMLRAVMEMDEATASEHMRDAARVRESPAAPAAPHRAGTHSQIPLMHSWARATRCRSRCASWATSTDFASASFPIGG